MKNTTIKNIRCSATRDYALCSVTNLFRLLAISFGTIMLIGLALDSQVMAKTIQKTRTETIYVLANDPTPGRNAVLAYSHNADDCLQLVGIFPTGGTGTLILTDRLGPDDHDQAIITSPDGKFLFAVNQGSNSIAVFKIKADGVLKAVKGSPFPSGGNGPVSLGLTDDKLYVVNQNENTPNPSTIGRPNYTGFNVDVDGRLTPIPNSTVTLQRGDNPTQALISPDGRHLFGIEFFDVNQSYTPQLAPFLPARSSSLDSFNIKRNGQLIPATGSPRQLPIEAMVTPQVPSARYSLGLQTHPTENILYVGFILAGKFGVYNYDRAGELTFVFAAPLSDRGICWIVINKAHTRAYASNAISNSISVLNIEDPLHPVQIQSVPLHLESDAPAGPFGPVMFATTPFQIALDPDSETLYVKNQETTPQGYAHGNALHFLDVQPDGTLMENACSPAFLPIPANAHAGGVRVVDTISRR